MEAAYIAERQALPTAGAPHQQLSQPPQRYVAAPLPYDYEAEPFRVRKKEFWPVSKVDKVREAGRAGAGGPVCLCAWPWGDRLAPLCLGPLCAWPCATGVSAWRVACIGPEEAWGGLEWARDCCGTGCCCCLCAWTGVMGTCLWQSVVRMDSWDTWYY